MVAPLILSLHTTDNPVLFIFSRKRGKKEEKKKSRPKILLKKKFPMIMYPLFAVVLFNFEIVYFEAAVQHFSHYTTKTP